LGAYVGRGGQICRWGVAAEEGDADDQDENEETEEAEFDHGRAEDAVRAFGGPSSFFGERSSFESDDQNAPNRGNEADNQKTLRDPS
jgi:hypothetical protein